VDCQQRSVRNYLARVRVLVAFMGRNALSKRAQQLTNAIAAPLIEKKNASACKQPVEVFHPGAQMQLLLNQTKL
jgi:hypothetical protein